MTDMDELAIDILLERRNEFEVDGRRFTMYPPSLGISMMLKGAIDRLQLAPVEPTIAIMEAVERDPMQCCRIIALSTCQGREEAMQAATIEDRAEFFNKSLAPDDISTLLIEVIGGNKAPQFLIESGISKENERMRKVSSYRKNDTPSFGGKTIFGQLIDVAIERYGWTYEYAVWGVSYAALTVLLADKVTSVFLTEDERKHIPKHLIDNVVVSGDDPKNYERIIAMTQ